MRQKVEHGLHSPVWAGGVARVEEIFTVDEEVDLDYEEMWDPTDDVEQSVMEERDVDENYWTAEEEIEGVRAELKRMDDYEVYEIVDGSQVEHRGKIVDTREVKKAKMVDGKRTCRVRFVGRDYKWLNPHAVGLFAPTTGCSTQRLVDFFAVRLGVPTMTADVPAAFLHTPIPEDILLYCYPPRVWIDEDRENRQGKVWRLRKVLPGMREGAQLWTSHFGRWLKERGYKTDPTNPNYFVRESPWVFLEVHMDDLYAAGAREGLEGLGEMIRETFGARFHIHDEYFSQYSHLRRFRARVPSGMYIMTGEHHLKRLATLFALDPIKSKPKPTPLASNTEVSFKGELLDAADASFYRSVVGILLYIAPDRADIQYAVQLLAQKLKEPTEPALAGAKHVVRYLMSTRRKALFFPACGDGPLEIQVTSDSNWANCTETRRSTACGIIALAGCCLFSFVRRQNLVSLSSAEAEFYAATSAVSESLGIQQVLKTAGLDAELRVRIDNSGARALLQRQGSGRIRHLDARVCWAQDLVAQRRLKVSAVKGTENEADIGTKLLPRSTIESLCAKIGLVDRPEEQGVIAASYGYEQNVGSWRKKSYTHGRLVFVAGVSTAASSIPGVHGADTELESGDLGGSFVYFVLIFVFMAGMLFGVMFQEIIHALRHWGSAVQVKVVRECTTQTDLPEEQVEIVGERGGTIVETSALRYRRGRAMVSSAEMAGETVVVSPYGARFHLRGDCSGLERASSLRTLTPCALCVRREP